MKKNKIISEIIDWGKYLLAGFLFAFILNNTLIINANVISSSMESTIMTDSSVFASRISYKIGDPERFDIIVFKFPDDETSFPFVKRIIGLPGEKVEIIGGKVYINDSTEPLDDTFINEETTGSSGPYYVPDDSYFVMGDNRNNSHDSRWWVSKFVTRDKILGKAIFEWYPHPHMLY